MDTIKKLSLLSLVVCASTAFGGAEQSRHEMDAGGDSDDGQIKKKLDTLGANELSDDEAWREAVRKVCCPATREEENEGRMQLRAMRYSDYMKPKSKGESRATRLGSCRCTKKALSPQQRRQKEEQRRREVLVQARLRQEREKQQKAQEGRRSSRNLWDSDSDEGHGYGRYRRIFGDSASDVSS